MSQKPFKFRYTSEITGAFVLSALMLLVAAVLMSGQVKSWFEGKFKLRVVFSTDEGAFGLKQGDPVEIRGSTAGRVGEIVPNARGELETELVMLEQYHIYVRKDSVAVVKKRYMLAGDAYLDIKVGKERDPVADGFRIDVVKDQEITETAQKVLKNVQDVTLPMLEEVQGILKNVNGIVGSIEKGEGVAGSIVKDPELAREMKGSVENLNSALREAKGMLRESTLLIKSVQQHWLLRKYVQKARGDQRLVLPGAFSEAQLTAATESFEAGLADARRANDAPRIALHAANLALCRMHEGDEEAAKGLINELRMESVAGDEDTVRAWLLEAEMARLNGRSADALSLSGSAVAALKRSMNDELKAQARIMAVDAFCDSGMVPEAQSELKQLEKLDVDDNELIGGLIRQAQGRVLLLSGDASGATVEFEKAATMCGEAGEFYRLALALERAGDAYEKDGNAPMAADRYYRAARSMTVDGSRMRAIQILKRAVALGDKAGPSRAITQARALLNELETSAKSPTG